MSERPNILFLMTDQQRADLVGYAGNSVIRTPNLDRLAEDAVVFDNCYTPSPVCIPARQCMMSGQLPKTCNVTRYGQDLPPNYMTFARRLSQYSYETVVCGKLHHMGEDQYQGWTSRIGWDNGIGSSYITGRDDDAYNALISRGHLWWPWAKEVKRAGIGDSVHARIDRYARDGALMWIDEQFLSSYYDQANHDRPVMLKVSFRLPHYPYLTTQERFDYYLNRVQPFFEDCPSDNPLLNRGKVKLGEEITEREARRATAAYYGMMEEVDEMFGQVIDRLEFVGQNLDDWIIVFTSDHGDMMGEKGNWMKYSYYEGSARVPLFIRYPKKFQPKRITKNVNLLDFFPTFCDLCDVPLPEGHPLDGHSLVPLLQEGNAAEWDNETVSELDESIMIKRDDLKYGWDPNSPEVLFDLAKDPRELVNVAATPAYADAIKRFRLRANELGYPAGK